MKKAFYLLFVTALFVLFSSSHAFSQNVEVTNGGPVTSYLSLGDAFTAINNGLHTGTLTINIVGTTAELATAKLDSSGNGTGSNYSSILIRPQGGATRLITGTVAGPLIQLMGADNVTIDALLTGGNDLGISNLSTTGTTILLINDARQNTVTRCDVVGSNTTTTTGVIQLSTSTGYTGNSNNTFSNLDIYNSVVGTYPANCIFSSGTATAPNQNNTITNNLLHDFNRSGVEVTATGNWGGWNVSNNSFYQTLNNSNAQTAVNGINFLAGGFSNNNTFTGNYIGGTAPLCGSGYWENTATVTFRGIVFTGGAGTATSIHGNVIQNIRLTGSGASTFIGVIISGGLANVGTLGNGNIIGNHTADSSIVLRGNGLSRGINFASTAPGQTCNYNLISDIKNVMNTPGTNGFRMIDFATANYMTIKGNTLRRLQCNSTFATIASVQSSIQAISYFPAATVVGGLIDSNTIYSLQGTNTGTGAYTVIGIGVSNCGANVTRNIIYDLRNAGTGTTATTPPRAIGIIVRFLIGNQGSWVANNMISLGDGQTTNTTFIGIAAQSAAAATIACYYNSVNITGTVGAGALPSYGFYRGTHTTTTETVPVYLRNNIFNNNRTGGTGSHYAIGNQGTSPASGWPANSSDFNVLNGGSPATVGLWNAATTDFATWKTSSNGDFYSYSGITTNFVNQAVGNLRLNMGVTPTQMESQGLTLTQVTIDIDGFARPKPGAVNGGGLAPDLGASESDMVPLDQMGPYITYTNLGNSSSTPTRFITNWATISDPFGLPPGTGSKRIYYKKSTDANAFAGNTSGNDGWKWVEANNSTSPFGFTIDYNIIFGGAGTVSNGTIIQYFVVAQDNQGVPNVASNPASGFVGTSVSSITSAPTTPNSYTVIAAALAGDYTVGLLDFNRITGRNIYFEERTRTATRIEQVDPEAHLLKKSDNNKAVSEKLITRVDQFIGETKEVKYEEKYSVAMENGVEYAGTLFHEFTSAEKQQYGLADNAMGIYATLTAAVTDYNAKGISGHTNFLLNDATYSTGTGETFPYIIQTTSGDVPTSSAQLTIRPNTGVVSTVGSSSTSGIFVFSDPYINIIGDNLGGGVSRDLTIDNPSGAANTYVIGFFNIGNRPSKNCSVTYANIRAGNLNLTNAVYGIILNGAGGDYDNFNISNNKIFRTYIGIGAYSFTGLGVSNNGTIANNTIGDASDTSLSIRLRGIEITNADNVTISGNDIFGSALGNTTSGKMGIFIGSNATNLTISGNSIHDFFYSGTGGLGATGIYVDQMSGGVLNIVNNELYNFKGDSDELFDATTLTWIPTGITIGNNQGLINMYYNSIYMSGATLTAGFAGTSTCVLLNNVGINSNSINFMNNALRNSMTTVAAPVAGNKTYGVAGMFASPSSYFNNINFNSYNIDGVNPRIGRINGNEPTTMTAWEGQFPGVNELNSYSGTIPFTSTTNLNPDGANSASWILNGKGYPLPGITTDKAGNSRSSSITTGTTDIGCYEFLPSVAPPTATASGAPSLNGTTTYDVFGKIVCSITWGATGTVPGSVNVQYNSGQTPPTPPGGSNYGDGYWDVTPDVQPGGGQTFSITFNFGDNETGSITSPSTNTALAKKDGANPWILIEPTVLNWVGRTVTANNQTSLSSWALTDVTAPLPVELSSFSSSVNRNVVNLNWTTVEEINNAGFDIERKPVNSEVWSKVGNITGAGNLTQTKNYSFTDNGLLTGNYNYRLKQIDFNGNFQYFNLSSEVIVGVPNNFQLSQNYPNPFNPTTKINYDLPVDSKVNLRVYDMLGREVASMVNEQVTAGYYTVQFNASNFASGTYFFRLIAQGVDGKEFVMTKKMQLVK